MEAAYGLFSQRGVRAVSMEDLLEAANVSQATLETNFATKDDVVLAFLHRREHRWTLGFVEAEARSRGATARDRLLAIFDVFDEWFQRDDFEGCSFINVLVEVGDLDDPVGRASADHLADDSRRRPHDGRGGGSGGRGGVRPLLAHPDEGLDRRRRRRRS